MSDLKMNAVGRPYSANYDPNYKVRTKLTKIERLYKPMGPGVYVDDRAATDNKQQPQPAPSAKRGIP
jgi:hypothetical protein